LGINLSPNFPLTDFPVSEVCDAVPETHMFCRSDPDSGTFGQENLCTGDFSEIRSLPKRRYNQNKLLKPIVPENAEQRIVENRIVVNWHLNNVPERANKRSKLIRVIFTHEFLEDYSELSPLQKDKTDAKIKNHIESLDYLS
jgi:hypothetical protein